MKLPTDPNTAPGDPVPSASRWRTEIFSGPIYRGGASFSADVNSDNVLFCRLVYAGPKRTNTQAHAALAERALSWITSYEARAAKPA